MQGLSMMGVLNELFVKRYRKQKEDKMPEPKIILWRIMMENEKEEIVEFIHDIPDGLAKQIDELIAEFHPVGWGDDE